MPTRASKRPATQSPAPLTAEVSELDRTLEWMIQGCLAWPYSDWASDEASEHLRDTLHWLGVPEEKRVEAMTMLINLARGYRTMLDQQADSDSWKANAQCLMELAPQAEQLATSLEAMGESVRSLWALAESSSHFATPGAGLFPELHPERMGPVPIDQPLADGQGWFSNPQAHGPGMTPPDIAVPVRELADRLEKVVEWIKSKRASIGLRTTSDVVLGSPELDLLWNTKTMVVRFDLDPSRSYQLGKRIHRVVQGYEASRYWGNDSHRKVEAWYAKVGPWMDREAEAPEDIQLLLRKGPKAMSPRKRRR